ncbi:MAG: hypothetical protein RL335_1635 [Bacteroidota bacterium]
MAKRESLINKYFALVTGASQGIGLAICESLARRKHNLIMVSLPNEQIAEKASSITMMYGVEVFFYETDLTVLENCSQLIDVINSKHYIVNILINNAGIGSNGAFTRFPPGFYEKQIAINCQAPVYLCRLMIPEMLKLKKAHIVNMASLGAFFDMPHKEVYVASKSFIISFSRSLYVYLKNTSIKVSIICPGSVDSNIRMKEIHKEMKGIGKKSVMLPSAVAEASIKAMFAEKKMFIPGKINRILYWLNKIIPEFIQRYIVDREMYRQELLSKYAAEKLHKV